MPARRAVFLPPLAAAPRPPAVTPLESTLIGMLQVFILNNLKLFRISTYEKRRGKGPKRARFAQFCCNATPFRLNTFKSVSTQTTLSPFYMNTYQQQVPVVCTPNTST